MVISAVSLAVVGIGCSLSPISEVDPESETFQVATIKGEVFSTNGKSLEGANISTGEDTVFTDNEGKYEIPDVQPGKTYTVTASKDGYRQESKKIILESGQVSTVDFQLGDTEKPDICFY